MAYGYREGERQLVSRPLDSSTSAIVAGDILTLATAGYLKRAAAGDTPYGVSVEDAAAPAADGDTSILVDVSTLSLYEYPADAGSVTQALASTWLDVGGPQSIDIDATTDKVFWVETVNTTANTVTGRFAFGFAAR